jgi:hypothetical protein
LFDSGYSLVVLEEGGRRYKRGSNITIFFPNIALKADQSTCLSFKHGDHGDVGNRGMETNIYMSLTNFKAKMNKSKINKYKINNNNKTNTKHEFNVIW